MNTGQAKLKKLLMVCSANDLNLTEESTVTAQELYNPVLDSRAKAARLRATLIILSRHKEYFNLPSIMANDIKRVVSVVLFTDAG